MQSYLEVNLKTVSEKENINFHVFFDELEQVLHAWLLYLLLFFHQKIRETQEL